MASFIISLFLVLSFSCTTKENSKEGKTAQIQTKESREGLKKAVFAGGCFWCMEPPFEKLEGVISAESGYSGGEIQHPTYKQVAGGETKHLEVVEVTYDPKRISYVELLNVFWMNINPTQANGQFVDIGPMYTTAIFYNDEEERKDAEESLKNLEKSKRFKGKIVTKIRESKPFYKAEEYHQDYYKKSSYRYKFYRVGSGRDDFIKKHWGSEK